MNILVVSEYPIIRELLRSALRPLNHITHIQLSGGNDLNVIKQRTDTGSHDLVIYDLDSVKKDPTSIIISMLDAINDKQLVKYGLSSLILLSNEAQIRQFEDDLNFCEHFVITKPFTFKNVQQIVKNIGFFPNLN
ncbi:response regulator [Vibrio sp. V09_P4A23P171]|uniref:response regulator n=1 Tax=unclassified Vibrio TaxID=2614977 RepID=UPI000B8E35B1|nr:MULTISPECIES: response regulator [unclassified Vibrio]NAW90830.1 response regulator [Vibrio sp. V24_P1S3T111]OXX21800.1 response regulator [Vibrio sp. V05_P4A8T149]OXX30346.1 response regulator [Vibrio sp. V04_P4A5T148]OXX34396.1 response regulator [Vibrio sp. V14_P6S14T42]OXX34777.1 response regulator [Vibrio sp. V09_P4A23P171]